MTTGITFAKILVLSILLALLLEPTPAMDLLHRYGFWPGATAQVRLTSAPAAAAPAKTLPRVTRSTSSPAKTSRTPTRKRKTSERFDAYQVPAGTVLPALLRGPLDSQKLHVEDPVRVILRSTIKQDGIDVIPAASIIHGKVLDVVPASRWQLRGRIVVGFYFIEHAMSRSRLAIAARPLIFEAVDATGSAAKRSVDVRISAGEVVHITLAEPLIVRFPK
jgi:hypothetical protein